MTPIRKAVCAAFLSALLPLGASAQDTLIRDVRVLDVAAGTVSAPTDVAITGGRISAVADGISAPEARVIAGSGRVLAPGLWDSHVHVFSSPDEPDTAFPTALVNGVTGLRDMGALWPLQEMQALADSVEAGEVAGPRVILAGAWVDASPGSWPGMFLADTPEQAHAVVARIATEGWAAVKAYSMLLPETYEALAAAARAHGLPLVGHIPEAVTLRQAIDAGQTGMEHWGRVTQACSTREAELSAAMEAALRRGDAQPALLSQLATHNAIVLETWDEMRCRDVVARMAEAGLHVSPTLVVADFYLGRRPDAGTRRMELLPRGIREAWGGGDFRLDAMTDEVRDLADASLALGARVFSMAHEAGVPIMAGTDASFANPWIFHGFSLHDELARYVARGLAPHEALATATVVPRRFLLGESGRIEPGTRADLLLLPGNPLDGLEVLQRPDAVIVAGHVHDADALRAMEDGLLRAAER